MNKSSAGFLFVGLIALTTVFIAVFVGCEREVTRTEIINEPVSCFECHSDNNTFLVAAEQQWENSVHASGLRLNEGARETCSGCHAHEGFLQRVNGEEATGWENPTVIHCFTCHAPHSNGDFRLRWTSTATLENGVSYDLGAGNLCVACHHARRSVDDYISDPETFTSTHWGPHYNTQGDMLIGSNGYEYSDYDYEYTYHRGATRDGCVDCHKNNSTSNSVVGGHSFNMEATLVDHHGDSEEIINTGACAPCHGEVDDFNVGIASFAVQDSVKAMVEHLHELLLTAGLVDSAGHTVENVTTSADSAGAVWNFLAAEYDRSHGVHNRKYIMGLLESSIMFMEGTLKRAPLVAATEP